MTRTIRILAMLLLTAAAAPTTYHQKLPEGNYTITLTLAPGADLTVKAEQRRLMLEHLHTTTQETITLTVNTRTPTISPTNAVHLKPREKQVETLEWDDQLSLEFLGTPSAVTHVDVQPTPPTTPTLFILGDSTVCDQPTEPWASWGQMLPRFLKPGIAVANYAESGESLRSSLHAQRLEKVLALLKPHDFLLIQFGHNDMKEKGDNIGPFTSYKTDLKHYADAAQSKGATVILITPMERKAGLDHDTLGDYPNAVRQLATESHLPLIDLHAMSKQLYKALGPDLDRAFQDGTHHTNYGAYELAKCITQGLKDTHLDPLTQFIPDDFHPFDPTHPDPVASVNIPPSANTSTTKPEGN